jgi:serine/threonine protein kinase
MPETLPRKFGKCLVVKHLGKGATAVVLLARHEGLSIPVAVKVLRKSLSESNPRYAERFLREARMAARLDHPNIVRVIDCGVEDEFHYMVMDYVDGPNCLQKLRDEPDGLDWRDATEIVMQSSDGLAYAAGRDVIHRDVKPSNLMIDSTGRVRVTDLGLAKMTIKGMVELTQEFHTVGTPSYMSPEQIRSARDLDLRSDVYSLGATFYHLVVGHAPFSGSGPMDVVAKHLTEPLVPPIQCKHSLPQTLSSVICKMMAKSPDERYQDYESLASDLQNLLHGRDVTASGFFEAVDLTGADEQELRGILAELRLQDDLVLEDRPAAAAQPRPLQTDAAEGDGVTIDPFGPADNRAFALPEGKEGETAVMPRARPAAQTPNVALIVTLSVLAGLVLLAVVLFIVLGAQ